MNAVVTSVTGSLSVIANRSVNQAATGDLSTGGTGTVDVEAQNGTLTMDANATAVTAGGNIRYKAAQSVLLTGLNAGTGDVSVVATAGSITDNGDMAADVVGNSVRLTAAIGIGSGANHLDTSVTGIAARAPAGASLSPTAMLWRWTPLVWSR